MIYKEDIARFRGLLEKLEWWASVKEIATADILEATKDGDPDAALKNIEELEKAEENMYGFAEELAYEIALLGDDPSSESSEKMMRRLFRNGENLPFIRNLINELEKSAK